MSTRTRALVALSVMAGASRLDLAVALMDMTDRAERAEARLAQAWQEGRAGAMEDADFAAGFDDRANPYRTNT